MKKIIIDHDAVTLWRQHKYSWVEVAEELGVSISTLHRWRAEVGYEDPFFVVHDDAALTPLISDYLIGHPYRGEMLLTSHLRENYNVKVRRDRLRRLIAEIDPEGLDFRRKKPIVRRTYNGIAPGHVWHIDTHHKIGRFGFVTFGAVDGFTHEVMALHCCISNRANDLLNVLLDSRGLNTYGLPEIMRADAGLENVAIGKLLNSINGEGHFITGKSVHNQRIERFWGVMHRIVTRFYYDLLHEFEKETNLDLHAHNVWVLQEMLLSRINHDLQLFTASWNGHPMKQQNGGPKRSPTAQTLFATNSRYRTANIDPEEDELFATAIAEVAHELGEDYEGRPTARSECPFTNEETVLFREIVHTIDQVDKKDMIIAKLKAAFSLANELVAQRT